LFSSPWSNKYDPPLDDGTRASEKARRLEIDANGAFESYKDMYFEGGISSVYVWDREHGDGFNVCVLIKKAGDGSKMIKGCWDSVHVMECAVSCMH
jgi:capping protein beta